MRNPDGSLQRDASPASSCSLLGSRPDMIPRTAATMESSPEPMDPFFYAPSTTPDYGYSQDAFLAGFEGSQSPYSASPATSWPNEDVLFTHSSDPLFGNVVPQYPSPTSSFAGHARSTSLQSQSDFGTVEPMATSPQLTSPPGSSRRSLLDSDLPSDGTGRRLVAALHRDSFVHLDRAAGRNDRAAGRLAARVVERVGFDDRVTADG